MRNQRSFCTLPWIHLATHPIGTVTPCCITDMKDGVSTAKRNNENLLRIFNIFNLNLYLDYRINTTKFTKNSILF